MEVSETIAGVLVTAEADRSDGILIMPLDYYGTVDWTRRLEIKDKAG